jgi:hypothetical protein
MIRYPWRAAVAVAGLMAIACGCGNQAGTAPGDTGPAPPSGPTAKSAPTGTSTAVPKTQPLARTKMID